MSTNANPLGPSPMAVAAVRDADIGPYPDPDYTRTREVLAGAAGVTPDEVVVGAGATELIHRLVRVVDGPVVVEAVTFGEYEAAAAAAGVELRRATSPAAFVELLGGAAIAFVASPGNPDGRIRDAVWCDEVGERARETGTVLVWDLAYAPFVPGPVPVPRGAVHLQAPNKIHGCTGLRAGWLTAPAALAGRLRDAGVSWLLSAPGAAFLEATVTPQAARWVAESSATFGRWQDELVAGLRGLGLEPEAGDAPFVVVDVPDAAVRAARLRADHGIKVRDTTSLGRPGAWRVAAPPPASLRALLDGVAEVLHDVGPAAEQGSDRPGGGA